MISVIITTYNSSKTIIAAIESIKLQKNILSEIIIVDDHSDDFEELKSNLILLKYIDIKIIQPPKKGNANISRNLGVKHAKYKYIAFLDADDTWNDEHLFKGVSCLQSNNIDIVFSKAQFVKDNVITLCKQPEYRGDIADYIFSNGVAVTSSLIVKKTSFEKCIFDEEQLKHQDWEFLIRAQKEGIKIDQVDYIGLNYTLSTGSNMSSNFNPQATIRFLEKTLPKEYHDQMISSQLNAMINKNAFCDAKYLFENYKYKHSLNNMLIFRIIQSENEKVSIILVRIINIVFNIKNKILGDKK